MHAVTLDKHDCYELCVQSPRHVVTMLRSIHGSDPRALREDFCGTAAVARRWCKEGQRRGDDSRAVCTDLDEQVLARAKDRAAEDGISGRLQLHCGNALAANDQDAPDVIWVGNFSIGYIHSRADLLAYLKASRQRLLRGNGGFGGGVFACDLYGGAGAYRLGSLERTHIGRGNEVIKYRWDHETADPITGMVTNSMSLRVIINGELAAEYPRAFVYHWRLWSLAELHAAMLEAGFRAVEVYEDVNLAPGQQPRQVQGDEFPEDWIVVVAGRAE
jgi:hypothetical protein